jgi:hypothetical protein
VDAQFDCAFDGVFTITAHSERECDGPLGRSMATRCDHGVMIVDRFKFVVADGTRFSHRRATLNGFRLEMKLDPDDLPEGVELPT